ncbi:DUF1576 domain-containing protein [Fuchsiella alkaliacetigena]|uniref:DUF1576 domain-containing protein n=1 Tax=Fuchsiella alkaliacetigena TaxID=957042 RepID=UPI002009ED02|nr:DUF1576 domain-containing protein [Fuchsiella alkaliacetigena]MCK8825566.1 DUF1576 domain-containing protein [Fuchsiella alkaliacetigena]
MSIQNTHEEHLSKNESLKSRIAATLLDSFTAVNIKAEINFLVTIALASIILLSAFIFNTPQEILIGIKQLATAPSILVSDYIAIGNLGAAFFNSGILMFSAILITKLSSANINGTVIAAVLTIAGFAFFGKNIYNVWSIILGVYIYSRIQKEEFGKFILVALFGTALGPLVSQITFGLELPLIQGIILGNTAGIAAGFILPALANHVIKFHQGFNLYNIGFTAGLTGAFFMSLLRAFGIENPDTSIVAEGYNQLLGSYLIILFVAMALAGYLLNDNSLKGYKVILKHSGRLVADFVTLNGLGISLINMGCLGVITTGYIFLVGGELNGPILAGIFTVVGFGAFGKHIKNIIPLLIGVYIASFFQIWDANSTGALLGALFGTTLAPIAGEFGWKSGVIAGFLHMAIVMNVGYLHGGMNLYNNGFSGGIVAAILVPMLLAFRKETRNVGK